MARSTLPLFPTDDGWPYPDGTDDFDRFNSVAGDDEVDLDALELRADPHAFDELPADERFILFERFGLGGQSPRSMKDLCHELGRPRADVRDTLGRGIAKVRARLLESD